MRTKYFKQIVCCLIVLSVAVLLCSCFLFGGKRVETTTKLISTTLSHDMFKNRIRSAFVYDCGENFIACVTPNNVTGKVYYAGIMVGGGGSVGYSLGPIIGDVVDPSAATSFSQDELLDFDMAEQLTAGGNAVCCEGSPYPPDDEAFVGAIEIYFGYVDTTFILNGDNLEQGIAGSHTIRTVYGDINETELKQGDLLYLDQSDGTFKWCTPEEGCIHATRPADPIQYESVANYGSSPDGEGNQNIPVFAAGVPHNHPPVQLTESEVLSNTWLFVIDFDMTNGVVFEEDPAVMTQVQDLVNAFRLSAEPGNWGSGFMVSVTAEGTPMPIVDNETTTTAPGTISTSTTAISDNNSSTIPEALSFSMISPDHRRGQ